MQAAKHIKYYERCLVMFPQEAQTYDSSHSSLVFFCVLALELLGKPADPAAVSEYTASLSLPGGFRGSASHKLDKLSQYDPPSLSSTFFCICMLGLARDQSSLRALDRSAIHSYVKQCQAEDGNFTALSHTGKLLGEKSVRHLFTAVAILSLLGIDDETVHSRASKFILQCQAPDGGFGDSPDATESHAGLTYCCVCAVSLMGVALPVDKQDRLLGWLAHRQQPSGGFNGRPNKLEDTCYSFWVMATLATMGKLELVDHSLARQFLITETQDNLLGGFGKTPGSRADPLHSCLGLCALSLLDSKQLDPALCLPYDTVSFIKKALL